jgi:uncharacterized protein YjaG (DUF416 family)
MHELIFDERNLAEKLNRLSPREKLAFSISCAERLLPNYVVFHEKENWGDPEALRAGLDLAWEYLQRGESSPGAGEQLRARVEAAEPETEEFDSIHVSAALDAAAAVGLVLQLIEQPTTAKCIEIATLARDTVDMYVQELAGLDSNDPFIENAIRQAPLMQRELAEQARALETLQSWAGDRTALAEFEQRWRYQGSNIDLNRGARTDA